MRVEALQSSLPSPVSPLTRLGCWPDDVSALRLVLFMEGPSAVFLAVPGARAYTMSADADLRKELTLLSKLLLMLYGAQGLNLSTPWRWVLASPVMGRSELGPCYGGPGGDGAASHARGWGGALLTSPTMLSCQPATEGNENMAAAQRA